MVEKTHRRTMQVLAFLLLCTLMMVNLTNHNQDGVEYVSNTAASDSGTVKRFRDKKDYLNIDVYDVGGDLEDDVITSTNYSQSANKDHDFHADSERSYLLIQASNIQLIRIELRSNKEYHDVPFDVMYGHLEVITDKRDGSSVTINHKPTRKMNYTFGLGVNFVDVGLTSGLSSDLQTSVHYLVSINRLPRPLKLNTKPASTCYLEQDCSLRVYDNISTCGLVSSEDYSWTPAQGYWKIKCVTCQDEATCDWSGATWWSDNAAEPTHRLADPQLKACLANGQLMFLGDSTNRGIMQSVMERVNGSLMSAEKSHTSLTYSAVGGNTSFNFMYYPAFWLKEWPTFVQALYNLPEQSRLSSPERAYLVVGGVQWLTTSQLIEVSKFIKRLGIPASHVVVKTHSSGFLYPVDNVPYTHTKESLKKVIRQNDVLVREAKQRGFSVLDTLQMTLSRYKEFLQGKCACHFHEVSEYEEGELSFPHDRSSTLVSKLYKLGLVEKHSERPNLYHISGSIHDTYTDMLVSHLCPPE